MPRVIFIHADGEKTVVPDAQGTLMEAAVENGVPGIIGSCGGVCSCATCHVYIAEEWMEKVGPATEPEQDMLEFEENASPRSRLGCQVDLTDELDGLVVAVPEEAY